MLLQEFIKKFVAPNTMIRVWVQDGKRHKMVLPTNGNDSPVMSWELENPSSDELNEVANYMVLYVTDILCDTYWEAVNIVVEPRGT